MRGWQVIVQAGREVPPPPYALAYVRYWLQEPDAIFALAPLHLLLRARRRLAWRYHAARMHPDRYAQGLLQESNRRIAHAHQQGVVEGYQHGLMTGYEQGSQACLAHVNRQLQPHGMQIGLDQTAKSPPVVH